jgi:hypothetical protein
MDAWDCGPGDEGGHGFWDRSESLEFETFRCEADGCDNERDPRNAYCPEHGGLYDAPSSVIPEDPFEGLPGTLA